MSAPADRDASQLYYSYRIVKGGGGGEILVVVTQCLLLPTGTLHSYTTHTVSLRGGGGGDSSRSYAVSAPADRDASQLYYSYCIIKGGGGEREILAVVTLGELSRSHVSWGGGGGGGRGGRGGAGAGGGGGGAGGGAAAARVATPNDCEAPINC